MKQTTFCQSGMTIPSEKLMDPCACVLVVIKQINMLERKQAESLFHAEVASLGLVLFHKHVNSIPYFDNTS